MNVTRRLRTTHKDYLKDDKVRDNFKGIILLITYRRNDRKILQ